jgi:uncharacterized tellurite resistance protein B-like protein
MLKALKKLFEDAGEEDLSHLEERHLEIAVACLLHESKRVDMGEDFKEHIAAREAVEDLFGLGEADSELLLEQGRTRAQKLTSYFAPVSVIKRDFAVPRRVRLIEHLWRIAYADGKLEPDEDHYVRKIAHLLYVPNTESMLARSRARSRSG